MRGGNLSSQQQQSLSGMMNPQQQSPGNFINQSAMNTSSSNQSPGNLYGQSPQQLQQLHHPQPQQQAFTGQPSLNQQQQYGMMGGGMQQQQQSISRMQHKGVPQVIPNVVSQGQMQLSTQQGQQGQQQNAGAPNLMQKLNEITAPGGDILSKGKELIFMKFGLGGK
ncbi:hypothetical protein AMK59_4943 [Oryctes borbonicus]|uniref:Uncharacterized protein n=1 Tax=Oryctes borbonicus TaxID=1629725 RepID=A0A0T6B4B9_9SCAR|nr:hypothetical protein AMK59_4943 [Oryctes borbonicus]